MSEKKIPVHIAIIMDGNGRWAQKRGKPRSFGHREGLETAKKITLAASNAGIKYLSLYVFSTENWKRPKSEVNALMRLLVQAIENETGELMKKNEMLTDITTRLIDIEAKADREETKSSIRKVAIDIENSTQEKIWEEFELRFKQVHSAFYNKLNLRFPDLSPNEQRLCAFLKLNLTTKEISSITGQNARAIEMARFRLRKKLGISTQEINLVTFISQI